MWQKTRWKPLEGRSLTKDPCFLPYTSTFGTPEAPQLLMDGKWWFFELFFSQLRFGVIQLKFLKWMFQVPGRCSKIVKILGLIVFCVIMQLKLHTILYLHYIYSTYRATACISKKKRHIKAMLSSLQRSHHITLLFNNRSRIRVEIWYDLHSPKLTSLPLKNRPGLKGN